MNTPLIRLELEQMRYQVVHALGRHQQEISAAVKEGLGDCSQVFRLGLLGIEPMRCNPNARIFIAAL